eukprot:CAMPEP_0184865568 /NCGR_PEP_ID=MMETSP0580-20130426/18515_1 /TAXON_ID=1118495 /ORGANISM="Dactyliosolen fragilissimus" /LENGTH=291 /DNA_ID=CAMNT_0027364833 /DNA_START=36 /DNA_END=911 /DNA_ORIENTATION=+
MGAVHGVYLKYVGLSALSLGGYKLSLGINNNTSYSDLYTRFLLNDGNATNDNNDHKLQLLRMATASIFAYSAILNGTIAILFKLERGMGLIGKNGKRGTIPLWSYILYFPFHLPSILYTHVHTRTGTYTKKEHDKNNGKVICTKEAVPVATEVQPGWWVGGCYAHELNKTWGGVIDLTVEFPESCIDHTQSYLLVATWDGVPASPAQLDQAATFAVEARKKGDVLVHCAHGRGRSTTMMCAALVKAGLFSNWEEALEKGIRPSRPVCKLNSKMRMALTKWQSSYVDNKKVL